MADTTQPIFGGLVIGSADPDRLTAWYRAAFAPDSDQGDVLGRSVVAVGDARLVFDKRGDIAPETAEPGRLQINLFVTDIESVVAHLSGLSVRWVRPVENVSGFGAIGTFTDPDGNHIQLLQRMTG